jgi:hypothetical protein
MARKKKSAETTEQKTETTSFRLTEAQREELDAARKKTGRTQSEEILNRLTASFFADARAAHIRGLVTAVEALVEQVELEAKMPWNEDQTSLEMLCAALPPLLRGLANVEVVESPTTKPWIGKARRAGEQVADALAKRIDTFRSLPPDVKRHLQRIGTDKLTPDERRLYDIAFSLGHEVEHV